MREEWRFPNRATPPGSSAYYSVRFSPAPLRNDLAVLLAWHREIWTILDEVSDPGVARLKLQWWREELERTATGTPRHPLSALLAPLLAEGRLPTMPFLRIADRVEADILRRQPADEEALTRACEDDLGALFELLALAQGPADGDTLAAARNLGAFCTRVYLIRDSGALARRGRAVIPEDRLRAAGLSSAALTGQAPRTYLPQLLPTSALTARRSRAAAADGPPLPPALRIRAAILSALLAEIEDTGFDVADQRIGLTPLRKLWIGWRAR